jgi:hypothetical protein
VVGVAALYLSTGSNGGASPATVAAALSAKATQGIVSNGASGANNDLLYTNY